MNFETNSGERLFEAHAPAMPAARRRFVALLVLCLLFHAGMLFFLVRENGFDPLTASAAQEIPIEVVLEPPPQDKAELPAPKAAQPEVQNTIDEKPAVDAPRAANDEKIEREAPDEISQAPRVAPPPEHAAPEPAPESKQSPTQAAASQAVPKPSIQEPVEAKPDAAAVENADAKREQPEENDARAETKAQPEKGTKSIADLLAGYESLPDYKVGSAAEAAPVAGGRAKATYLTILYGLIMPHMHVPPRVQASASRAEGEVTFNIDGMGKLTYQEIRRSSGLQGLDAAALAAVRQAAPFPSPPNGLPLALTFSYSTK